MFLKFLLAFTLLPVIELYFLIRAGQEWGVLNTVWIVLLTGVVGAALARSQGQQVLMQVQLKTSKGEVPAREMLEGVCIFAGGLLLLTPGFVTDALGLSMVLPGLRRLWAGILFSRLEKFIRTGGAGAAGRGSSRFVFYTSGFPPRGGASGPSYERDVSSPQIVDAESERKDSQPSE